MLGRIIDGGPHRVAVVAFGKGSGGTAVDALTATHAQGVHQIEIREGADGHLVAASDFTQSTHGLQVIAGAHTAETPDALVHIPHDGCGIYDFVRRRLAFGKSHIFDAVFGGQALQFAGAVAMTGVTFSPVLGYQQFQYITPGMADGGAAGFYHGCLIDGIGTGSL